MVNVIAVEIRPAIRSSKSSEWRAEVNRLLAWIGGNILYLQAILVSMRRALDQDSDAGRRGEVLRKICVGFAEKNPAGLGQIASLVGTSPSPAVWLEILNGYANRAQGRRAAVEFFRQLVFPALKSFRAATVLAAAIMPEGDSDLRRARDAWLGEIVRPEGDEGRAQAIELLQLSAIALGKEELKVTFKPYSSPGGRFCFRDSDVSMEVDVGIPDQLVSSVQAIFDQERQKLWAARAQLSAWLEQELGEPWQRVVLIRRTLERWAEIVEGSQVALYPEERVDFSRFPALRDIGFTGLVLRRGDTYPALTVELGFRWRSFERLYSWPLENKPTSVEALSGFGEYFSLALWGILVGIYHSLVVRGDPCFGEKPERKGSCLRSFRSRRAHLRNPPRNGRRCPSEAAVALSRQRAEEEGNGHLFSASASGKSHSAIYISPSKRIQLGGGWSTEMKLAATAADRWLRG